MTLDCSPLYEYKPNFTESYTSCEAPNYNETRSRLSAGGGFFRSVEYGDHTNYISLEVDQISSNITIYFNDVVVETYVVLFGPSGLADLRTKLSSSEYVEMPTTDQNVDYSSTEDDVNIGLFGFAKISMSGGGGLPSTQAGRDLIRTGPERTVGIIQHRENSNGTLSRVGPLVKQWNGVQWVEYGENEDCREV
jgi:hypothetical protein